MKTKWDCLFSLFELKEARLSEIAKKTNLSPSATRQKLVKFLKEGLITEQGRTYAPNKQNRNTWLLFNIMKFCRNKKINHNIFLTREFASITATGIRNEETLLSDFKGIDYKTVRKYLTYLSRINLLFVVSKKPLKVKFISDPVFESVLALYNLRYNYKEKQTANANIDYAEIERLMLKFNKLKKDLDLSDIEEEQKIEFTSASTQLEGNTFTLEESKDLILHDAVPEGRKLKEANEVKNYYSAVNYLISHLDEPLSIQYILDLHRIVISNLSINYGLRSSQVSIKGNQFYKVAHFSEILLKLELLCNQVNEFLGKGRKIKEVVEFATFAHNEFQHIHPFEDGNSRVTRLIWNYVLMRSGFPLVNIYSNTREEYLAVTKLAKERNDSKLNSFLAKIILDNLYKLTRM